VNTGTDLDSRRFLGPAIGRYKDRLKQAKIAEDYEAVIFPIVSKQITSVPGVAPQFQDENGAINPLVGVQCRCGEAAD
jgi:hypothetical protein